MRSSLIRISLAVLLVASCAKKPLIPPEPAVPYEGPVNESVLRQKTVFSTMRSVRSEVSVRVYRGDKHLGKLGGVFLYSVPGSMRLRLFDPFGSSAMDMVSSAGRMQIYVPSKGVLYEGAAPALGMPEDAVYGMELGPERHVLLAFRKGPGADGLELAGKFYFDAVTLRNTAVDVYGGGRKFMAVDFGSFYGGLPMQVRIAFYNGFSMEMALIEPEVNVEMEPDYFDPIPGAGKRVLPLQRLLDEPNR